MDRRLKSPQAGFSRAIKGGAHWALPFCLSAALLAPGSLRATLSNDINDNNVGIVSAPVAASAFVGSLDVGASLLYTPPQLLNSLAASAGFPKTNGLWLLWGGGATLNPGAAVSIQVSAWEGSLGASAQGADTAWDLGLGEVGLAQAYPVGSFIFTAGMDLEAGDLQGSFLHGSQLTGTQAALFGYGLRGGMRWPAQSPASFYLGVGWDILTGPGNWHGSFASDLGDTLFELGGPDATLQFQLGL